MEKRLKLFTICRAGFTAKPPATTAKIWETMRRRNRHGCLAVFTGFHMHFPWNGNRPDL
jgi:hypothetical protein